MTETDVCCCSEARFSVLCYAVLIPSACSVILLLLPILYLHLANVQRAAFSGGLKPSLLVTEQPAFRSHCHVALVIKARGRSEINKGVRLSSRDLTPLDVLQSDKAAKAVLQLQSEER